MWYWAFLIFLMGDLLNGASYHAIPSRANYSNTTHLEHVVVQGLGQGLDAAHVVGAALHDEAGGGPHGQPSVGDLLGLEPLGLGGVALHVPQGIQAEVARGAVAALPSAGGGDAGHGLDEGDHDEAGGDVLGVGVPELPERVCLALGRGGLAAGGGPEELHLEEARHGQHGHAPVLELGLAEPVEVDAHVVDVGQAQGVEAHVAGHAAVEERRPVHEWKGLALLGGQRDRRPGGRGGGGEGDGRSGQEGQGGELHHGGV
mmetsp:Transcript_14795/g.32235  ORF Transcript_14795/g.32235 Transcript_14795/m.32235 type:complete len:259 (-) Transcript_14795:55-831(-)